MANESQLNLPPALVDCRSRLRESAHPETSRREGIVLGDDLSLTNLLAQAAHDVGLLEKETALSQGYDPKYWSRTKTGEKHAYLDRVMGLDAAARREFLKRWAEFEGLEVREQNAMARAVARLSVACAALMEELA